MSHRFHYSLQSYFLHIAPPPPKKNGGLWPPITAKEVHTFQLIFPCNLDLGVTPLNLTYYSPPCVSAFVHFLGHMTCFHGNRCYGNEKKCVFVKAQPRLSISGIPYFFPYLASFSSCLRFLFTVGFYYLGAMLPHFWATVNKIMNSSAKMTRKHLY